jgi:pimeloyl-ACP methyl ester carboxylesterase
MSANALVVDAGGHRITGISNGSSAGDLPLLVALHGGSYTSAYFDVPGHSLLETGQANGFEVVALDRPGYGGSSPFPSGEVSFARNAEILDAAVAQLWEARGGSRPGIVVIAHSIGAAIAVHLAARRPAWPLLGIALSGIHDAAPAQVRNAWDSMPAGQPVVFTPEQRRMFFYGPDWTIEADIVERAEVSAAPIPLEELLEVVSDWPQSASDLAAEVGVPVQFVGVEFERLWTITPDTVRDFAGYFAAAPFVDSHLMPGIGHDGDHHRAGRALQLRQLAFALQCAELIRRTGEEAAVSA